MKWHRHSVDETLDKLATSAQGLSAAEADRRRQDYGLNELQHAPPRSRLKIFTLQFADFMILVLIGAAVISGVIGEAADAIVILTIVIVNGVVGFVQEYRAERALEALKAMAAPTAMVLREGHPNSLPAAHLVPGDAVLLEAGRIVPADLRVIESANLRVNESALTGESVPVDKTTKAIDKSELAVGDRNNIAHKGTFVTYGRGVGVVVETGMRTELGRIAQLIQQAQEMQTPLQRRLAVFGRWLAVVVLLICAVIFGAGLMRGEEMLPMLLTALSLAVAAIPEALPAVVSVSLALGARKMMAHRALIRRLPAVETLGSVTYICSDKTGTLTANQMRVDQYFCDGKHSGSAGDSGPWRELLRAMAISHDARPGEGSEVTGDPTEVALLIAATAAGVDQADEQARAPRIDEIAFDAERKCMTTVHKLEDGSLLSITKGAVEVILANSVSQHVGEGTQPVNRASVAAAADEMAAQGLRVLGVAVRRWRTPPESVSPHIVERELEFVGLVGMIDPPRDEVRDAVATCSDAGISVVMITGDHPRTASTVAARLGLVDGAEPVLTGTDLAALSMEEFSNRVRDVRVYARVAPEQKLKIVTALQRKGEIVAMTGDGVNDAPALRQADIGIAMGVTGTDVAKEASAMVLLDDNFTTIVKAVREGRRIYDNLRRFIRYVMTTNSGEIWTIFLAPFLGLPVPLLPIQILWINLLTDGLPGLALASERAERNVMQRPPRPPRESVFAHGLGVHAFLVGLLMAALALGAQALYLHLAPDRWQSVVFTLLCFMQLGHVLAIRSEQTSLFVQGVTSNPLLLGAVVLTMALQLAVLYVPPMSELFSTTPLRAGDLVLCIAGAGVVFAAVEFEKAWRRRRSQMQA